MPSSNQRPTVAVIVPVYNQPDLLALCVDALARQTYPADRRRIIVVDNGSDGDLGGVLAVHPDVTLLRQSQPGSYAARNLGIAASDSEIVAFTDADCIPAPDWLTQGVERLLATPNCGLVAGRIELFAADESNPTAVELYEFATGFEQHKYAARGYGATANVLTFRRVIEHVGPFEEHMWSGADKEWGKRVHAHGYAVVYAGDATVRHPARASRAELFRKKRRVIGGEYDRSRLEPRERQLWRLKLIRKVIPPLGMLRRILGNEKVKRSGRLLPVALITVLVHYLQTAERWRLTLGGRPTNTR